MRVFSNRTIHEMALTAILFGALACGAQDAGSSNSLSPSKLFDLNLEQLLDVRVDSIYTASRRMQKTWEAPASVSIVTRDEFKTFGYRTLADALRSVPGIYTTYDRYYTYFGVRGFGRPGDYNSRALLLIDGHRANDNIYDAGLVGPEATFEFDLVDRLEVIRGPSSSVYGSSAFFGVFNVLTRRGGDIQGIEASSEYGTFDTYKLRVTSGYKFDCGFEFLLSGSYYESRGPDKLYFPEYNTPEFNHGVAEHRDYERNKLLFAKLSYHDFTLMASMNSREKGISTGLYGAYFNDPRAQSIDDTRFVDLKYEKEFESGLHVLSRVAYHSNPYRGWYPVNMADPGNPPSIVNNRDAVKGEWWGVEDTVSKEFFDRLTLTAGLEFRDNFRQDQANYDESKPRVVYGNDKSSSYVTGLYAQGDLAILTNLVFSAGMRYDYYSTFGDTVSPRVGLMYRPWSPTTFKLLYGRAFRAPDAYESSFAASYQSVNHALQPETIDSYELVWEQRINDPLRLTSSLFYNDVHDLIAHIDNGTSLTFRNADSARAYGIESAIEGRWTNGWLARASYSEQRAEDGDTGADLSNAPRHLGKFHLRVPLWKDHIFAGGEMLYVSSVKATRGGRTDGYWLANLTLFSQEIVKGLELSASIYNLFDTRYSQTPSEEHLQRVIPQDGRSFRIKMTYKF